MSIYTLTNVRIIPLSHTDELKSFHFVNEEVLTMDQDRRVRQTNLDKAVTLGKSVKCKTSIAFETKEGIKRIEEIVMAYDLSNVWISGRHVIPLNCVRSIDFL